MKNKFSMAMSLAVILAILITSLALAAELVTAEVTDTANDVTVTQGTSVTSTINLSATGSISCLITSANASTATVDTSYSLSSAGALTTGSPSSAFKFYSNGVPQGGSGNCGVTWDTASTPYSVTATFSAAATTPVGNYTVTLQDSSAGSTDTADITNPSVSGGKLGDVTATTITVHVIAAGVTDSTGPVITPIVSGTLGNNGWYISDVTVSWSVVDAESAISSSSGCDPTLINTDTTNSGTTLTCTATSAGGTSSQSVTIQRDTVAPIIIGAASPNPNANGWNNTDVFVGFSCNDGTSFLAFCDPGTTLTSDGANQSVTGTATDVAGNSTTATVSGINIDKTAPTASATASPAANANGWNNSTVTVSFSGNDSLSGIDFCDSSVTLLSEGGGQTASGTCTDKAGNVSPSASITVNIDETAPSITAQRDTAANGNGWNNTNVVSSYSASDALSGLDSGSPASGTFTFTSEGANQSHTFTVTDQAGNSASASVNGINIDKTAPSVSVTGVTNGATYTLGSVPAAGCSTSDTLSGVATNATLSTSGGPVGSVTASCGGALDNAGNSGSASVTYSVVYNWTGFFQPIDNNGVFNVAKSGSTIPVKFSLGGDQGMGILWSGYPTSIQVTCPLSAATDAVEEVTTATSGLKYDALANQYIYNWKTASSYAGTCRQLTVKLADGSVHTALFKFTK